MRSCVVLLGFAALLGGACSDESGSGPASANTGGSGQGWPEAGLDGAGASYEGGVAGSTSDAGPVSCGVPRTDVSSPAASASWRYGGGDGHPDQVLPTTPCTTVVSTAAELAAALESAQPKDVVYVADDARIDLSGQSLCIPAGVTLASCRGRDGSPGGLLFVTVTESKAMLRACGDDVRVTGLRLFGWEPDQCPPEWPNACAGTNNGINCRDCMPRARGIQIKGFDRVEVDNSELTGWSYGAVELIDSLDAHVHHNYIHHNQRQGLGYGVVLSNVTDPADALIEFNRFDYNRHSVAGSGAVGHSYEARNNLVLPGANGHVFDMHGIDEAKDDGTPWAGTNIHVHHNTVLPDHVASLVVRGRPTEGSWFHSNCVAPASAGEAAQQKHFTGNFWVDESPSGSAPNGYGKSAADCETLRFCIAPGAAGPSRYLAASSYGLASLGFGDFDGDTKTDVFRTDGTDWWWLPAGKGSWQKLNTSTTTLASLAFGDFDGDGKTDAFRADGSAFSVSSAGSGAWSTLSASSYTLPSLRFGDFDGDGKTDVFRADGAAWWMLSGGAGSWKQLNVSSASVTGLGFGDFDGDGKTDVFQADGTNFRISSAGASPWKVINTSGASLSSLRFGDFDGDGKTDVLRPDGTRWHVSWAGAGSWQTLAVSSDGVAQIALGDFDGDGKTDAFRTGCL